MVWIIGLNYLLGWEHLPLSGCFGYVKLKRCLMIKLFSHTGYLPVHNFASFIVIFTICEASRPIYRGVYTVEGHGEGFFIRDG
jgi:hypothetical protein